MPTAEDLKKLKVVLSRTSGQKEFTALTSPSKLSLSRPPLCFTVIEYRLVVSSDGTDQTFKALGEKSEAAQKQNESGISEKALANSNILEGSHKKKKHKKVILSRLK